MTALADTTPALPPNTPLWVVILVAAIPAVGAIGAALFQPLSRAWGRRKRRRQDAERALIKAEEKALLDEVRAESASPVSSLPPAPKGVTAQVDTGMRLVEDMVRDLQDRVKRLEASRDEVQHRLDEVEHELAKREVEVAELRAENSGLRRENDRLRDQINNMTMMQKGRGP